MENFNLTFELLVNEPNEEFVRKVQNVISQVSEWDLDVVDLKVFSVILPAMQFRFEKVFKDYHLALETSRDKLGNTDLKENLKLIFASIESAQELLHYVYSKSPVQLRKIKAIIHYIPQLVRLTVEHTFNDLNKNNNTFNEELSMIKEVTKHLYASLLYLLENSLEANGGEDATLLAEALLVICQMPEMDASSLVSSWKCFVNVVSKQSSILENQLKLSLIYECLIDNICWILQISLQSDPIVVERQMKCSVFLIKILYKLFTEIFPGSLKSYGLKLLIFYTKILTMSSIKSIATMNQELLSLLDGILRRLLQGQHALLFKNHIKNISIQLKERQLYEKYLIGFLTLMNKIMQIVNELYSDWSELVPNLIEDSFNAMSKCENQFLYEELIVNLAAAILLQDINCQSPNLLLKFLLNAQSPFISLTALDLYTLVLLNVTPEESLTILLNLLYGIDELEIGFFTNRSEVVFLKLLLQRGYKVLPKTLQQSVVKLFPVEKYPKIWKLLSLKRTQEVLEKCVEIATENIDGRSLTEEVIVNIAESLHLLGTSEGHLVNTQIEEFLRKFWSIEFKEDILENNIFEYFVSRILPLSAVYLDKSLLLPNLKLLSNNLCYSIALYKILFQWITQSSTAVFSDMNTIIQSWIKSSKTKPLYMVLLKNLNDMHNESFNLLLDSLNPNTAKHIFEYINNEELCKQQYKQICTFQHHCLKWNETPLVEPPLKKIKLNLVHEKPEMKQELILENDSIEEVINRIKDEVKCLLRITKTEKLSQKDVSKLRVVVNQLSSLM